MSRKRKCARKARPRAEQASVELGHLLRAIEQEPVPDRLRALGWALQQALSARERRQAGRTLTVVDDDAGE